ncbi:MAG: glycine cleavage system protein T, partial [Actinobacteria bacterium]|nr:glycine cleavage system protein T [Actinomycetota bacterium]
VLRNGEVIGQLSSGNFSPTLGYGIALAFLDPSVQVGDQVMIDQRGTQVAAEVVKLPFLSQT